MSAEENRAVNLPAVESHPQQPDVPEAPRETSLEYGDYRIPPTAGYHRWPSVGNVGAWGPCIPPRQQAQSNPTQCNQETAQPVGRTQTPAVPVSQIQQPGQHVSQIQESGQPVSQAQPPGQPVGRIYEPAHFLSQTQTPAHSISQAQHNTGSQPPKVLQPPVLAPGQTDVTNQNSAAPIMSESEGYQSTNRVTRHKDDPHDLSMKTANIPEATILPQPDSTPVATTISHTTTVTVPMSPTAPVSHTTSSVNEAHTISSEKEAHTTSSVKDAHAILSVKEAQTTSSIKAVHTTSSVKEAHTTSSVKEACSTKEGLAYNRTNAQFSPCDRRDSKDLGSYHDDRLLWCEGCGEGVLEGCRQHDRLVHVPDSVIPCRALLTAPSIINFKLVEKTAAAKKVYSCFAKKLILPGVQFGPYEGKQTTTWKYEGADRLKLKLFCPTGSPRYLDCVDQDSCNWMMFIRPAKNLQEQNLVAYQYQGAIYYTVIRAIAKNEELKVWYARNYALCMGETIHEGGVTVKRERVEEEPLAPTTWRRMKGRKKAAIHYYSDEDPGVDDAGADNDIDDNYQPPEPIQTQTPVEPSMDDDEPLTCGECGKTFPTMKECTSHDCKQSEKLTIKLKLVGRRTRNKRRGRPLKVKKKNRIKLVPKDPKPRVKKAKVKQPSELFSCDQCELLFPSNKKLHIHTFSHSGEMRFKCDLPGCNKGFNAKSKLLRHQLVHNDNREFPCGYCEKAFLRKDHLKNHLKVHGVNSEKHHCDQCAKEYTCLFSFKVHLGIHAAERGDRNCAICGELFDTRETLEHHLKLHSRARTTRSDILEKNHACPVCSMRFYTMLEVRRHMLVHTKEKHFLCQFCPQQFGRKDHLVKHMKAHHRSELPEEEFRGEKKRDRSHVRQRKKPKPTPTEPPNTSGNTMQSVESYRPGFSDDMAALQNVSAASFSALQASYSDQVLRSSELAHPIHGGYPGNAQNLGMNFALGGSTNVALEPQADNNYHVHVWQASQCQWPQGEVKK